MDLAAEGADRSEVWRMGMMVAELGIGAVLGALFVAVARLLAGSLELHTYAVGLLVAAFVYVAFAVPAHSIVWLLVEILGVLLFGALAVLGLRVAPVIVGAGWGLHIAWDALLHGWTAPGVAPTWYPGVCAGFDLTLAVYIVCVFRDRQAPGLGGAGTP